MSVQIRLSAADMESLRQAAIHFSAGRHAQAIELAAALCRRQPGLAVAHKLLGSALHLAGRSHEAVAALEVATRLAPEDAQSWSNLGNALGAEDRLEAAMAAHRRALALQPGSATFRYNLGCLLADGGQHAEALEHFWHAYECAPGDAELARLCRQLLVELGDAVRSETFCRLNLRHLPDDAGASSMLGGLLLLRGEIREAESMLRAALARRPEDAEAWSNLCVAMINDGRAREAVSAGRRAVEIAPGWARACNNLGVALRDCGAWDEARQAFLRALSIDADCADAWYNLGCVSADLGAHDDARAAFIEAVTRIQSPGWLLQGAHACRQVVDWGAAELMEAEFARQSAATATPAGPGHAPSPFACLTMPGATAADQLHVARSFAALFAGRAPLPPRRGPAVRDTGRTGLRIGLLSADFRDHATAHLMTGVLEALDPTRFHLTAYDYGPPGREGDDYRRRLQAAIPDWVDVAAMSDREAAQRMQDDGVDIVIDLKGWTQGYRAGILACRPAPIQMQWLGFPGTMGAPWIDYVIADAVVIPHGAEAGYGEQVLRLPGCYQPNDRRRAVGAAPSRAALGLPDDAVVLAAFHQYYKITREMYALWLRVLATCPRAVLWMLEGPDSARSTFIREAEAAGIGRARLIWAPRLPAEAHLGRLMQADLALDTFPVNAHTTASDALWAGVPHVALCGDTFVSRVSASILSAAGLHGLVACDYASYEALVCELASDSGRRGALRTQLRVCRAQAALFDAATFARRLGSGLEIAWARHRQRLPAAHIDVPD